MATFRALPLPRHVLGQNADDEFLRRLTRCRLRPRPRRRQEAARAAAREEEDQAGEGPDVAAGEEW